MAEKNYGNNSQLAELVKYISDTMKFPIIGAGGGFAPIGTRGYFEGQTAPQGWLICDGSTKNITDYPDLATYIASQHGSVDYYGGDGTTTFGLPTMNGMPNNGIYTTEEHIVGTYRKVVDGVLKEKPVYQKEMTCNTGNGAEISTAHNITNLDEVIYLRAISNDVFNDWRPEFSLYSANNRWGMAVYATGTKIYVASGDLYYDTHKTVRVRIQYTKSTDSWSTIQEGHSSDGNGVFCIKATLSDTELNNMHVYSPNEHQVGWWQEEVDGVLKQKPVYEKYYSVDFSFPANTYNWVSTGLTADGFDQLISGKFYNKSYGQVCYTLGIGKVDGFIKAFGYAVGGFVGMTLKYTKTTDQWETV